MGLGEVAQGTAIQLFTTITQIINDIENMAEQKRLNIIKSVTNSITDRFHCWPSQSGTFIAGRPNFIAGRPKVALLFWFFMVVLLSICLLYVSIVATCIAAHFAVCHALYNNKSKKIGKNRCLVFLNDLVLFCSVILSL